MSELTLLVLRIGFLLVLWGFVFAIVAEQDPITGCHVGSDLVEGIETAVEATDPRLTSFLTSNASVAVPLSVEYKATRPAGRVTELPADAPPAPAPARRPGAPAGATPPPAARWPAASGSPGAGAADRRR